MRIATVIQTIHGVSAGATAFSSLDGAEDGDRGRDDAVAVEERRAEENDEHEDVAASPSAG